MTPEPILVDSSCLNGLADDRKPLHDLAVSAVRRTADRQLWITDGVFSDFLHEFATRGPENRKIAASLVRRFDDTHRVDVIRVTRPLFVAGLRLYEANFQGTVFSLQQCILIHLAQERRIHDILSSERDFGYIGLNPLIRR